jgi:hypothetical protein
MNVGPEFKKSGEKIWWLLRKLTCNRVNTMVIENYLYTCRWKGKETRAAYFLMRGSNVYKCITHEAIVLSSKPGTDVTQVKPHSV